MSHRPTKKVHLYFYTDSIAFPRIEDQTLEQTWPFLIKDQLEALYGVRVYLCLRGLGGGTIGEISRIFLRDSGYFRGQGGDTVSLLIFNMGVVDASPRPFTYSLRIIGRIPLIGPKLWHYVKVKLNPHRAILQRIWSYKRTPPHRFKYTFDHMVKQVRRLNMAAISIDTPLTPISLENRSPGLRAAIQQYNSLKRANSNATHLAMDWVRDEYYLEDGHHFNVAGHSHLADRLMEVVRGHIKQCS
jgi:hypothetical protein